MYGEQQQGVGRKERGKREYRDLPRLLVLRGYYGGGYRRGRRRYGRIAVVVAVYTCVGHGER